MLGQKINIVNGFVDVVKNNIIFFDYSYSQLIMLLMIIDALILIIIMDDILELALRLYRPSTKDYPLMPVCLSAQLN